jgi:hypothetical protein
MQLQAKHDADMDSSALEPSHALYKQQRPGTGAPSCSTFSAAATVSTTALPAASAAVTRGRGWQASRSVKQHLQDAHPI